MTHSRPPRLLPFLFAALAAAPAAAHAQDTMFGGAGAWGSGEDLIAHEDAPTLERCLDPVWARSWIGQLAWADAANDYYHVCAQAAREWEKTAEGDVRAFLLPEGLLGADTFSTVIDLDRRDGGYFSAGTSYLAGHVLKRQTALAGTFAFTLVDPLRKAWEANGTQIRSCAEFVYEAWYDYSRFEDAIAGTTDNPRAAFVAAYGAGGPGAIARKDLRDRSGALTGNIAWPAGDRLRNAYYAFELDPHEKYAFDPYLLALLKQGRERPYTVSWEWHEQMSKDLAGYSDDELHMWQVRQRRFLKLMERRRALIIQLVSRDAAWETALTPIRDDLGLLGGGPIWDPVFSPGDLAGETPMYDYVSPTGAVPITDRGDFRYLPYGNAYDSEAYAGGGYGGYGGGQMNIEVGGSFLPTDLLPTTLEGQLFVLDAQIADALWEAYVCIDPSRTTPCDWAPEVFADQVVNQFVSEREQAFHVCQTQTGDDFSDGGQMGASADTNYRPSTIAGGYRGSVAGVRDFFTAATDKIKNMTFPIDPETKQPVLGKRIGDTDAFGTDDFNANYDFFAGYWYEDPKISNLCGNDLHLRAKLKAGVKAFGLDVALVDADTHVYSEGTQYKGYSFFKIRDTSLYVTMKDVYEPKTFDGLEVKFDIVDVNKPYEGLARATVWLGPIPVTFEGGVVGVVGIKGDGVGTITRACADGAGSMNIEVKADLRPFAKADGYAAGFVGVKGARVGMDVSLLLLSVALPLHVELSLLTPESKPLSDLTARVHATLHLPVSTMDGHVDVFAELIIKTFRETLVSWRGRSANPELLNDTWELRMGAVRDR